MSDLKSSRSKVLGGNKRTKAKPIVTPRIDASKNNNNSNKKGAREDFNMNDELDNEKGNASSSRLSLFNLRSKGNKPKGEQRIGELPNKNQLQAQTKIQPMSPTDIVQIGGEALVLSSSTVDASTKKQQNRAQQQQQLAPPESPSAANNISISSFSSKRTTLNSPSKSFGALGGGGLGLQRSFGNFFGGSSRSIMEPQQLVENEDDDGASVSSDPSSQSRSSTLQSSAFESMFPGAPVPPTTRATKPSTTTKTTTPTYSKTPATPSRMDRLFSSGASVASSSTGTVSSRPGVAPQAAAQLLEGDLNWIPIVRQTGLAAAPFAADDEDSRSVSSDQSEMRGPQARKQRDKKNKQQQQQKHKLTKEEIVAAEMAAQLAALRKSAEKLQKRYHSAEEDPLPLESAHNPDATTAKLQRESSEWHEATGPAGRKHAQEHLKDRDDIESEPVRKRRDKRSNRREGRNTKNSPTFPTLSEIVRAPEPLPIEVELDLSSGSMPSLANYSTSSMAADAFSKQYVVATTTDAKQHTREDPSSKKLKRRNYPAVTESTQSSTLSAHSAESSYTDESSEVLSLEEPLSNTNGPKWLATVREQPPTNGDRNTHIRDKLESSSNKSPQKKGTGGKVTTGLNERLTSNRSEFETLSSSILSGDSTLGGSSHMEEAASVPFASSSSVLCHPKSMGNDYEDDDDIPKPKSWIQRPQIAKAEAVTVEDEVPEADHTPWRKMEEDTATTAILSSVNPRPYASNDDEDDDDNNNRTVTSSPKRRRSRRKVGTATSKVKTEQDVEQVREEPLPMEKEWHSTWTRDSTEGNDTYVDKDKSPRRSKSPKSKKSSKISKQLHLQSDKEIGESSVPMEVEEAWHGVPVIPRTANGQESDDEEREKSMAKVTGQTPKTRSRKDRKMPQESRGVSSMEVSTKPRSRRGRSKSADQNDVESQPNANSESQSVDDEEIEDVVLRDGEGFHPVMLGTEGIEQNGEYHQKTLPLSFLHQTTFDHVTDGDDDADADGIEGVPMRTLDFDQTIFSIQPQSYTSWDVILHDQRPHVASASERGMSPIVSKGHTRDDDDVSQESNQSSCKTGKNSEWHGLTIKPMVNQADNSQTVGEGHPQSTATKKQEEEPTSYHGLNETENAALADLDMLDSEQSTLAPLKMKMQMSVYPCHSDVEVAVGTSGSKCSPSKHQFSAGEIQEDLGVGDGTAGIQNEGIPRIGAGANCDGALKVEDTKLPEAIPVISYVDSNSDDSSRLNAGLLGLERARQGQDPSLKRERAEPEKNQSKNIFGDEVPEAINFFGDIVDAKVRTGVQKVKLESSFVRPPRPPVDEKSSVVVMSPLPIQKLLVASSTPNSPFDDLTIQSVDRGLGDLSRLNKLHENVSRRREALTSMLEASKNKSLTVENELLALKRKLAISQALVQDLEIENDQIRRQSVLAGARIQTTLLERLHKREIELENQVKRVMKQRNAAVEENHELRMIIMGSCARCRSRKTEKEFVMDYSIRDTILERRRPRSSFAWITGSLSAETQVSKLESRQSLSVDNANHVAEKLHYNDVLGNNGHDSIETGSLATSLPDSGSVFTSNLPVFTEAPLLWLSERLFQRNEKTKKDDDLPLIEEVITFKRNPTPRVRNVTVEDGDPAQSSGKVAGVIPAVTLSKGKKKHSTKKKANAEGIDDSLSSHSSKAAEEANRVIPPTPASASASKPKKSKGKKKKTKDEGLDESFSSWTSKGYAEDCGVIPSTTEAASKPKKKESPQKKSNVEDLDDSLSCCSSKASAEDSGVILSTTDSASMTKKAKSKKKKTNVEGLDDDAFSSYHSHDNEEHTGVIPSPSTSKPNKKTPKKKEKKDKALQGSFSSCSSIEDAGDGAYVKGRKKKKSHDNVFRNSPLTGLGGSYDASQNQEDKEVSSRRAPEKQPIKDPWAGPMEPIAKPVTSNGYGDDSTSNREQTGKQESANMLVSEKKKSSFFGSLMGEQVLDEFASFGFPSSNPVKKIDEKKPKPKIFSFFGSLMAEQVDDDAPFITAKSSFKTPTILEAGTAEKPETGRSKLRALLKEERVEDDMMALRDVVPGTSTSDSVAQSSKFPPTTDSLGLEDLRDEISRLENQTGVPASPQKMTFLGWSRDRLNREEVKDDMSFLKSPQVSPTRSIIARSLDTNSKSGDETREEMSPIKPILSSISEPVFSSPFSKKGPASPRRKRSGTNRGRRGSTRESPVPNYLNKFRSSVVVDSALPEGVTESMADARNSPVNGDLGDSTSDFPDGHAPLGKRVSSMGFGSLDADLLGSRPWRSDTVVRKLTSKLPIQVEGERESPFDLGSDDESTGEYDPRKAAMALQDDPLGALDAIDSKRSARHSVGLGGDPLSALDALPGDMLNYSGRESSGLGEDTLSYLDALAGGNSYSPGIDDELANVGLLPL
jgi:hypothetical protein